MATASGVTVIVNRRAARLAAAGGSPLLDVIHARRPGVSIVETRSLDELDAAAVDIAKSRPEAVVLAGGDGSYMAGVTALTTAYGEDALPPIGLAPGGTVSTIARNWGFEGGGLLSGGRDAAGYTALLLDGLSRGSAVVTRRPSLRVRDERLRGMPGTIAPPSGQTRIGFIVGAGLVSRFFEIYDEEGAQGYRGAAKIVARVFAGSFARGRTADRVLSPITCTLHVDGVAAPFDQVSLVCASVVKNLGLGMHLLYRAGEDPERFHVVASPLGPSRLGPQLPLVLAGRPLLGPRVDTLARELTLGFPEDDGAYVLDGELIRASRVVVTAGPVLRIVSL